MPFVKQAVADAREPTLVDEGEYELRIVQISEKDSKKGKPMIECLIEIEGVDEEVEPIFHYINLVSPDDEEKSRRFKLRMTRRFLEVFNIPYEDDGFDTDDLEGATGTCLVTQQERVNEQGEGTGEYAHALRLPAFGGEAREEQAEEERPSRRAAAARRGRAEPEPEEEVEEDLEEIVEEVLEEEPEEELEEVVEEEEEEPPPPPRRGAKTPARKTPAPPARKVPARRR